MAATGDQGIADLLRVKEKVRKKIGMSNRRWQYRSQAVQLREDVGFIERNGNMRCFLNTMIHCTLPDDAPPCCCTQSFQRNVLGEQPPPIKYYDCSKENQQLRDQLQDAFAYRDMFAQSQLHLQRAKDDVTRLSNQVAELQAQLGYARDQIANQMKQPIPLQTSSPVSNQVHRPIGHLSNELTSNYISSHINSQINTQSNAQINAQFNVQSQSNHKIVSPIQVRKSSVTRAPAQDSFIFANDQVRVPQVKPQMQAPLTTEQIQPRWRVNSGINSQEPLKAFAHNPAVQVIDQSPPTLSLKQQSEAVFKAGNGRDKRPNGEHRLFFYNGAFHNDLPANGVICNGEAKTWYANGQLERQMFFVNGKREGQCKLWYPDGKISRFCVFNKGVVIGSPTYYDVGGNGVNSKKPKESKDMKKPQVQEVC